MNSEIVLAESLLRTCIPVLAVLMNETCLFSYCEQFNLNMYALVMGTCRQNLVKRGQLRLLYTISLKNITDELRINVIFK